MKKNVNNTLKFWIKVFGSVVFEHPDKTIEISIKDIEDIRKAMVSREEEIENLVSSLIKANKRADRHLADAARIASEKTPSGSMNYYKRKIDLKA